MEQLTTSDHLAYLQQALALAHSSPLLATNFRIGALLLAPDTRTILSTGYTNELPGNTHAEQCCLAKLAAQHALAAEQVGCVLPAGAVLYTTMEPCVLRKSGAVPCVERILGAVGRAQVPSIASVVCGVREPDIFVAGNNATTILEAAGIKIVHVQGLEERILEVAKAGHAKA